MQVVQPAKPILVMNPNSGPFPGVTDVAGVWVSLQVRFSDSIYSTFADTIVREVVWPIAQSLLDTHDIDGFFFVRYQQSGPHIRLRLRHRALDRTTATWEHVREMANELFPTITDARAHNAVTLQPGSYEPEYDRYGGTYAMPVTEEWFQASSELAIQLLPAKSSPTRGAHVVRAFCAALALLHAAGLCPAEVRTVAAAYERTLIERLIAEGASHVSITGAMDAAAKMDRCVLDVAGRSVWSSLTSNDGPTPSLADYRRRSAVCFGRIRQLIALGAIQIKKRGKSVVIDSWEDWVRVIAPSFIHMTCNRLGLPRDNEAYMARMLSTFEQ